MRHNCYFCGAALVISLGITLISLYYNETGTMAIGMLCLAAASFACAGTRD